MRKIFAVLFATVLGSLAGFAQEKSDKPKLVVGIIVDQMRQEYLYRFSDRFVEGASAALLTRDS